MNLEIKVRDVCARETPGLDIRWFSGAPDRSESPIGYKDATKVKAQIEKFGLATLVGEIQPRSCIVAGEQEEPYWARHRREKKAAHTAEAAKPKRSFSRTSASRSMARTGRCFGP